MRLSFLPRPSHARSALAALCALSSALAACRASSTTGTAGERPPLEARAHEPTSHPPALADAHADAASSAVASPARPCGAALPPGTTLEAAPDAPIAEALLPTFDRASNHVAVIVDAEGFNSVTDCRGHATAHRDDPERAPRMMPGDVEIARLSVGRGHQVVWVTTGFQHGLCDSPVGFLALVRERGQRVEVEGVAAWAKMCDGPGHAKIVAFGPEGGRVDALLVPNTSGADEPGGQQGDDAYVPHDGELAYAGFVALSYTESPVNEIEHGWAASMGARIHGDPRGIVADEAWTFEPHGLPGAKKHTKTVTRVYALQNGKLEPTPKGDPAP